MIVRFYADVPEFHYPGLNLYAWTTPGANPIATFKRVAFDVDMPPDLLKKFDVQAPITKAQIIDHNEAQP